SVEAQMAGGARPRALDPFLHRLRRQAAEAILRPLSKRRRQRLDRAAACAIASTSRRSLRPAARRRMADRADAMDTLLPRSWQPWSQSRARAVQAARCL